MLVVSQQIVYGGLPPVTVILMAPFFAPGQLTFEITAPEITGEEFTDPIVIVFDVAVKEVTQFAFDVNTHCI